MPPTRRTATVEFVRGSVRGTRRRALATLPSLFTLGNMFCGFFAILVSIRGDYDLAAVLIGLSVVFDITDGAVARLVGAVTPFGLQFDSLADLVSFGLAPSLLVFTLFSQGRDEWDPLGWVACFIWVACAAIRPLGSTARRSVFTSMPGDTSGGSVFTPRMRRPVTSEVGLPRSGLQPASTTAMKSNRFMIRTPGAAPAPPGSAGRR